MLTLLAVGLSVFGFGGVRQVPHSELIPKPYKWFQPKCKYVRARISSFILYFPNSSYYSNII